MNKKELKEASEYAREQLLDPESKHNEKPKARFVSNEGYSIAMAEDGKSALLNCSQAFAREWGLSTRTDLPDSEMLTFTLNGPPEMIKAFKEKLEENIRQ